MRRGLVKRGLAIILAATTILTGVPSMGVYAEEVASEEYVVSTEETSEAPSVVSSEESSTEISKTEATTEADSTETTSENDEAEEVTSSTEISSVELELEETTTISVKLSLFGDDKIEAFYEDRNGTSPVTELSISKDVNVKKPGMGINQTLRGTVWVKCKSGYTLDKGTISIAEISDTDSRLQNSIVTFAGLNSTSGLIACNITAYVSDTYGTEFTGSVIFDSMKSADYTLEIDESDSHIFHCVVEQNGGVIVRDAGVYRVNNGAFVSTTVYCEAGYAPCVIEEKDGKMTVYRNQDMYDAETMKYVITYRPVSNVKYSIIAREVYPLTIIPNGINCTVIDVVSNQYAVKQYPVNEYEYSEGVITTDPETDTVTKAVITVPKDCYLTISTNSRVRIPVASLSSSLANPIELTSMPTASDDSEEYRESLIDDYLGTALSVCPITMTKATTLYLGYKSVERKVTIPDKVSVKYLNSTEDGVKNYEVADGGKTLKLYQECTIKFSVVNNSGDIVRVYRKYTDSDNQVCKEELEVCSDTDETGRDTSWYEVSTDNFESIEIERHPVVTVTFAPIHATYSLRNGDQESVVENQYKVESGVPVQIDVEAEDGYYVDYVSLTGKKEDALEAADSDNGYTFTPASDTTVVIKAVPNPDDLTIVNDTDATISFTDAEIKADPDNAGNYKVPYNVSKIRFTLVANKDSNIDAVLRNSDGKLVKAELLTSTVSQEDADKVVNEYFLYADEIGKETNYLIISEKGANSKRTFTVTYKNEGQNSVVLKDSDGKAVEAEGSEQVSLAVGDKEAPATKLTYEVNYGDTYSLVLRASDRFYVGKVSIVEKAKGTENKRSSRCNTISRTISLEAYMDTDVEIASYGMKQLTIKREESEKTVEGNYNYSISPSGTTGDEAIVPVSSSQDMARYTLEGLDSYILNVEAAGEELGISSVDLNRNTMNWCEGAQLSDTSGRIRLVIADPDGDSRSNPSVTTTDTIPTLIINSSNKSNRLTLSFEDGTKMTLYVSASAVLSAVRVIGAGVKIDPINPNINNDTLSIPVDRVARLTVYNAFGNTKGKDGSTSIGSRYATLDNLDFKLENTGDTIYTDCFGNECEYVKADWYRKYVGRNSGVIQIMTGDVAGKTCNLILFEKNTGKELAKIKVTVTESKIASYSPTVSVTGSDDISVSFDFRDISNLAKSYRGKQYYRIIATPKNSEHSDGITATRVEYVPVERPVYPDEATDTQMEAIEKKFVQSYKMRLNDNDTGKGEACDFDFTVDVVQTKCGVTSDDIVTLGKDSYLSSKSVELEASTKNPVFETKLSIKKAKGATGVYTGQQGVLVGTATFSKDTSCKSVEAYDVTFDADKDAVDSRELIVSVVDDTNICVDTQPGTSLGKHTISVVPVSSAGMYAQAVTLDVTVVKGIEKIVVSAASNTVYKKDNAAATIAFTTIFNDGDTAPKIKKASYEILDESGIVVNSVYDSETSVSDLDGKVKISGNKVTIDKTLDVSGGDVSFRIRAVAADYEGNTTETVSDLITVTSAQLYIGSVKLVKWDREERAYKVVADSSATSSLTVSEIDGATVLVLKKGSADLDSYDADYIKTAQIETTDYILKSSNAKALAVEKVDGANVVRCNAIAKNIKLTATTTDGGKQSKALTVTSTYYVAEDLAISIAKAADGEVLTINSTTDAKGNVKYDTVFAGNNNTRLKLNVADVNSEAGVPFRSLANYSVAVSGGKLLSSDMLKGEFAFVVSADKATVTIINKGLNAKDPNYKKVYTITNSTYVKSAAPSIKVAGSLKSGDNKVQTAVLNVKGSKAYDPSGKYAIVSVDEIAASAVKTMKDYKTFTDAFEKNGQLIAVNTDANGSTLELPFDNSTLAAGNYKVSVVFGTLDEESGELIQDAKTVSVTIKAAKPKANKGLLKITAAYSMKKDSKTGEYPTSVAIKYTAKELYGLTLSSDKVYNCNVKGIPNEFTEYFEVVDNGDKSFTIKLKDDLEEEDLDYIRSKAGAVDRQAYLVFDTTIGDDGYGNHYQYGTVVKITINM